MISNNNSTQVSSYFHRSGKPGSYSYIAPHVLRLCNKYDGKNVIDLGCGNGALSGELIGAGFEVVGVEPSHAGVRIAKESVPEARFYQMSVYDDPNAIEERGFDIAVSTEVVEHLYNPLALLGFASNKLREGGLLILSTPYHGYLKNLLISLVNGWDKHHQPLHHGGHIKFWSKRSLSLLLESNEFEVLEVLGAGRLPWLWKSMILVARKIS